MKIHSLKFFWVWASALASLASVGQDSLTTPVDTIPLTLAEYGYLYRVDSLWLNHLDSVSGLIATQADTTLLVLNESSHIFKQGLDSLNELTPLDLSHNSHLDRYINEYLRYKHQLSKLLGLSALYFPQMETILDRHDIPLEIKSLSVIESALNPNARSPRGATGLWQFMLPTARECGLTINSYVDERKDPRKSTEAACLYLKKLYSIYGVWELSIAAYNCGPGNVNKAIRKAGGSKNFWEIRQFLPRETQKYVPRFMAMCYLMEFGDDHGVYPSELDITFWQVDTVIVNEELRFDQITEKTSIATQTLTTLNPQYKLKLIPLLLWETC
jgi:membrane-bound lytic murein transglycosylase D